MRLFLVEVDKVIAAVILAVSYFVLPKVGCVWNRADSAHFVYMLCHANVFHLTCNIIVLFTLRNRIHWLFAYGVAVISSFLPKFASEPTIGFSGMLFAMIGMSWGQWGMWRGLMTRALLPALLIGLLPHFAMALHVYCLTAGYIVGWIWIRRERKR